MSNAYSAQNAQWRERLMEVVGRLADADLDRPAGGPGWTVGGLLAHMAFYDYRALTLLDKWKKNAIGPSGLDIDVVNDSLKPLFNVLRPRELRRMVVQAAEDLDAEIDALDPGFLSRIESEGKPVRLNRAAHREHHLGQIEKAVGAESGRR